MSHMYSEILLNVINICHRHIRKFNLVLTGLGVETVHNMQVSMRIKASLNVKLVKVIQGNRQIDDSMRVESKYKI